jgi:hypothetical protein
VEIIEKRGKWCILEEDETRGIRKLHKFRTELEAKEFLGFKEPVKEHIEPIIECNDESCDQDPCECEEEAENGKKEKESSKEKTSPNKQKTVLSSKGSSKKKI